MAKTADAKYNVTIQFRAGESFGRVLASLEKRWNLSRHEAARRLGLMSVYGINIEIYEQLATAADNLGGHKSFESVCEYLNGAFRGAALVRPDSAAGFVDVEERTKFVQEALSGLNRRIGKFTWYEEQGLQRAKKEK